MDSFIQKMMEHHKFGANSYTKNLKTSEDYYNLLSPVYEYYKKNHSSSEEEMYRFLYQNSSLEKKTMEFIEGKKRASGMVLVVGTAKHHDILSLGNKQELSDDGKTKIVPMQANSIFDMSSVTKLFTCIVLLKLIDEKKLKLADKISDLDSRFTNLFDVTVEDLLTFRIPIKTADRIENVKTFQDAKKLIFSMTPDLAQTRLYTDMGAIVLGYVIETISGTPLYELVEKYILEPCAMEDTVFEIASEKMNRVVSNNFERKLIDERYLVERDVLRGVVHDGKARKLEQWERKLYGHAGLFSTGEDMSKLAQGLITGKILDLHWLEKMGVNRTGKRMPTGKFSQFHGYLCYSKNPIEENSEVNHWLSGNAFALGGYTGNQITIDYLNQVYVFMVSNRCHNRVTTVTGEKAKFCGSEYVEWNDGKRYLCNRRYAYERDESVIRPAVELALQYRFLEYLMEKYGH